MEYSFCDKCDNMMYISLRPDPTQKGEPLELTYSCKLCGFQMTGKAKQQQQQQQQQGGKPADAAAVVPPPESRADANVVMIKDYADKQAAYQQYVTPYLKYDPTLPRTRDIECVLGAKCKRPGDEPPEVIYVEYDPKNLGYLYHCVHCGSFWKDGGVPLGGVPQGGVPPPITPSPRTP